MPKTILVIDDESVTRRVVIHALKVLDVDVLSAADGAEALAQAQAHEIALAIVDINLPDIDGFEVMRQLKQMPHMQDVPMIAFTARNQTDDQDTAEEVGASGLFYKPFSTMELRELVKRYL
jgi:CheY-like chemotaxis protein